MNCLLKAYEQEAHRGVPLTRDELVVSHLPLVKFIVDRIASSLPPHLDRDDLRSAAVIGLISAAERFDPSRGVQFKTFAEQRIRGTIMDELRAQDWLTRSLRDKFKRLEQGYDFVLIDTGAGIPANVTGFAAAAREIMLVVTPEPTSITDAYALVKTLSGRYGELRFKLLVNRCRDLEEGASLFNKLSAITGRFLEVSLEYSGCILNDEMLVESVRRRGPLCRLFPDAKASLGFRALAQKLTTEGSVAASGMPLDPPAARRKEWRNHELSS